ncbi:MAG: hypothetical protein CMF69_01175 [Magnetovibrio sp.]|nr:hypothetical protein [Magnetovibrio sp.]|tara:strand:- start:1055 stop:1294 length:240 start_codon:yes stop_codon:yes gene_type:complete
MANTGIFWINAMVERIQSAFDYVPPDIVNDVFWACVYILQWACSITGISYEALNIWLFIIIQPALIAIFAMLWLHERRN